MLISRAGTVDFFIKGFSFSNEVGTEFLAVFDMSDSFLFYSENYGVNASSIFKSGELTFENLLLSSILKLGVALEFGLYASLSVSVL